jgi:hypothetical protein
VQFASPVNMVSAIMQGGDLCENAPGLRINTSNVEIAAMFAPKPMLLVSATGDWTRNVPKEEFPAIKRIYELYGKADQVDVVQVNANHNFNRLSREAVYRFFSKIHPDLSASKDLTESDISVPMLQDLSVLSNHTLPTDALSLEGVFSLWKRSAQVQNEQKQDPEFLRERLRQTLAVEIPRDVIAQVHGKSVILSRASKGDRVPGVWISGKGKPALVLNAGGSSAALKSDVVKQLRKAGRTIFIPILFQTGEAKARRPGDISVEPTMKSSEDSDGETSADAAAAYFLTFNVTVDAARVQDILTAIQYALQNNRGVELFASGDAAIWAKFAAAVCDIPISLQVKEVPTIASDADYLIHFNVPGILRAGGLEIADKLANRTM